MFYDDRLRWRMRERCYPAKEAAAKHERIVKEASRLFVNGDFDDCGETDGTLPLLQRSY
jgi:hypothetical protein